MVGVVTACGGGVGEIEFSPRPQVWLTTGEESVNITNIGSSGVTFSKIKTSNETVFKYVGTTCVSPIKVLEKPPCSAKINVGSPFKKGVTAELIVENAAGAQSSSVLKTE
jgi:hypothetical protein